MKIVFSIIGTFILLSFIGISKKDEIQKTWISTYSIYEDGEIDVIRANKEILRFNNNELTIKKFLRDFYYDDDFQKTFSFIKKNKQLLVDKAGVADTFFVNSVSEDSMILSFSNRRKCVYKKLERFSQGDREEEFHKFLTNNTFTTFIDSVTIEFLNNGKYVYNSFNIGNNRSQMWMLDKFEDELFLVTNDIFGSGIAQIKDFDENGFLFQIYWENIKEFNYKKTYDFKSFETKNLIGTWEHETEMEMPPPVYPDEEKYYKKETLEISDSTISKFYGYGIRISKWEVNRNKNSMIFQNKNFDNWKQWNILFLDDTTLKISRRNRNKHRENGREEVLIFTKKKEE